MSDQNFGKSKVQIQKIGRTNHTKHDQQKKQKYMKLLITDFTTMTLTFLVSNNYY